MAFRFRHLKHSINDTLEAICQVSCNPSNQSGFCLSPCWEICPSVCVDPWSHHPPLTPPPHNSASPAKLLVILFTILSSASLALFIYFCYAKRRRSRSRAPPPLVTQTRHDFLDEDHGPVLDHPIWYIRTVGLQASVIDSIAVFRYRKGDGLVELTDCSVCLSEFQEDEVLRLLPKCSHAFHIPCIDTWLRSHTNCPVCRAPVVLPPPRAPSTEVNSGNSSVSGEPQVDTWEENREPQWEIQFQAAGCEIESNTREMMEEGLGIEMVCTEGERRSISFDSSEASKISQAIALNSSEESPTGETRSESQLAKGKEEVVGLGSDSRRIGGSQRFLRLVGSSPIGRSLQSGPIFLKRSVSCYGESSLPSSR